MDRSEIRARILDGLNDPGGIFVTAAQANAMIDEAAEVMAEESGAIKRSAFLAIRPGTIYYSLTSIAQDVMAVTRVWDLTQNRRLRTVTMGQLDERHETWPTVTGTPEVWFPVSWDLFGVWPGSAEGGGQFRVDYLGWPRALFDDQDEPEYALGDHDAFVTYGVYDGLAKRWDVKRMLESWSLFRARMGLTSQRSGMRQMQTRRFRTPPAEQGGFTTGVLP